MQIGVAHGGNGPDRLDHMADHVDDGQVDDGPVDDKPSLHTVRDALLSLTVCEMCASAVTLIHLHKQVA